MGKNGGKAELVTLTEAARLLSMKQSNTAAFLGRRGIEPVVQIPQHRRWNRAEVEQVRVEYEASKRFQADQLRRQSARRTSSEEIERQMKATRRA